jgi:hypothetical protein
MASVSVTCNDCYTKGTQGDTPYPGLEGVFRDENIRIRLGWRPEKSEWFYHAGLFFDPVNVAQGTTIHKAHLTVDIFELNDGASPGHSVHIYGHDIDDCAMFTAGDLPYNITKTSATTNVTPSAVGVYKWDVTAIVQEIVNRVGWVSGNAMRFLLQTDYSITTGNWFNLTDTGLHTGRASRLYVGWSPELSVI